MAKTYNEEDLKILSTLTYDNIDSEDESRYKVTDKYVIYNFKDFSDKIGYSVSNVGVSHITSTLLTGKVEVQYIDAAKLDLAKVVDDALCELCVMTFRQHPIKFNQVSKKDFKTWVKGCGEGVIHCNEETGNLLGVEYYKTSLPNGTVMFTPDGFLGVVPYKLDEEGNLAKFGVLLFDDGVKFAHVLEDE